MKANTEVVCQYTTEVLPCFIMKFCERLRIARKNLGWTQAELSEKSGISQATISKIERGDQEQSVHTPVLASALQVDSLWLATGTGQPHQMGIGELIPDYNAADPWPALRVQVPLISWVQAGELCESAAPFQPDAADEWMPCPVPHSKHAYALRVRGPSMEPKFHEGEIVVVDPEAIAFSGRFVIAKKTGLQEVTLKQLIMDGGETYLKAANPNWPDQIIRITEQWIICGVVICKIEMF